MKKQKHSQTKWWMLIVCLLLPASLGCYSTRAEQTRHLCRPIFFHCDDYRRKCAPPVCDACCNPSSSNRTKR